MIAIPSRHRSLTLLAAIVLAQVLLLAVQIKSDRQVRLIRVWSVTMVSPLQRVGAWTIGHIHAGWSNYVDLRHTRRENQDLRSEVERLRRRNGELEGRAAEADRLADLFGFRQAHAEVPMLAARVIGVSADSLSRTIYINRGRGHGVRKNMGVITPDGAVGKVLEVYPSTAQVLLLSDKESGVGSLLATTRTQGTVDGTGEPLLVMNYVRTDEQVSIGEQVLTSGLDRIFPKDLPIGTVAEAKPGNPFKAIRIKPAAHLDRLEEVFVLLTLQELDPKKELPQPVAAAPAKTAAPPQ